MTGLPDFCNGYIVDNGFEPIYRQVLTSSLAAEKREKAKEMLHTCRVCPRNCEVNRWKDEVGTCLTGRWAKIASYGPHFGEEDCLRGWRGSGTIFFAYCNLKCVFCQNFDISRQGIGGRPVTTEELAALMLHLQDIGCHNINFVTPEHVVPQVCEAILLAVEKGLKVPIVYNTSAYDSQESLDLMNGLIDIYMPDFKYWDPAKAKKYLKAEDYPSVARHSIKEMHRQVGPLVFSPQGLALRGVLIRHLVMPGGLDDTKEILSWIARELGTDTYVNIMDQYYPAGLVGPNRYPEINRRITGREYEQAVQFAHNVGLWRLDYRWRRILLWV
ncbi:MAG: radical SAM protein [Armatimonadetes bacterium]|nr:radical SAM protein [Armatimonadota bacterium]MDW8122996.1 radical SAM protein [Armatimonadota bacterium]